MANINTFNDINRRNNNAGGGGGGGYGGFGGGWGNNGANEGGNQMAMHEDEIRIMQALSPWGSDGTKPPRKENLWDMFRFSFCARSKILSFVVMMIFV